MPAWTDSEDKQLLVTCLAFDLATPHRWEKIAARMDGKTAEAVRQRFQKLKRDVDAMVKNDSNGDNGADEPAPPAKRKRGAATTASSSTDDKPEPVKKGKGKAGSTATRAGGRGRRGKAAAAKAEVASEDEADVDDSSAVVVKPEPKDENAMEALSDRADTPGPRIGEELESDDGQVAAGGEGSVDTLEDPLTPGPRSSDEE
ncbi:hypothetical protein ANO11243_047910 [Dothideomycetidae sp. 11243]|nr:hypothetical protein ANO11243_047910 [fungal sp. No.11243]